MATMLQIARKQALWDDLNAKLKIAKDMADRCRESDMMDMAETYDDDGDSIQYDMDRLENWLIDHNAPGWVAT